MTVTGGRMKSFLAALFLGASFAAAAEPPVSMGHHHINTADVDASKHFWSLLGATPVPFGDYPVMRLPDLLIFLRQQSSDRAEAGERR